VSAVARWVSIIGHPFVMTLVMVAGAALRLNTPREAAQTVLLVGVVALVPIGVLMLRQVRSGSWTNVDASNRAERPLLFTVAIAALAVLLGAMIVFRPESSMIRGAVGVLAMLAACAVATRWIKVSLHMAFATLAATTLLFLGSPLGWPLVGLLPALAWSRLVLKRHSAAEVAVGLVMGAAFGYGLSTL
jgi:hypothetical protein